MDPYKPDHSYHPEEYSHEHNGPKHRSCLGNCIDICDEVTRNPIFYFRKIQKGLFFNSILPDLILGLFTWTHVTRVQTQDIEEKEALEGEDLEGEGTQKEIAQESSPEEIAQKEVAQKSAPEETNQKEVAQESAPEESTQKEIAQKEASEEKIAEGNILIFFKNNFFILWARKTIKNSGQCQNT